MRTRRDNKNEKFGFLVLAIFGFAGAIQFLGHEVHDLKEPILVTPVLEMKVSSPSNEGESSHSQKLDEYRKELAELLKSLPTKESLKSLSEEEAHATPEMILQAALRMAKVTDHMERDQELRPLALDFYTRCAVLDDGLPAIQAVCLKHARSLSLELSSTELDVAVNAEVENLAW